jgi:hypothetical protein
MNTYLLTWNPTKSPTDGPWLEQGGRDLAAGKPFVGRWRTGNNKGIQIGNRVFMLRQGTDRPGIIGSGKVIRGAQLEDRGSGKQSLYCRVQWDSMLPDHELSKAEILEGITPILPGIVYHPGLNHTQ